MFNSEENDYVHHYNNTFPKTTHTNSSTEKENLLFGCSTYNHPYLQCGEIPAPSYPEYLTRGWRANKGPQDSNTSGFHATGHRVLLKPFEIEKKTESGLVLIEKTVNQEEQSAVMAVVVEIGNDCWNDKSNDFCQVGDKVLIGMYTGKFHVSPVDGVKYRFVQDLDIISPVKDIK
jgi:co-chaperonin GroES (HSP10)